jgi:hypothetical protein
VKVTLGHSIVAVLGLALLASLPASADTSATASAKVAIKVDNLTQVFGPQTSGSTAGDWTTVMTTTIKTPSGNDLIICPSFQCGLYTATTVNSKGGNSDTSTAEASLQVQVLVDGQPAQPGPVIYNARTQTLSATLGGYLNNLGILTAEQISLVLDTTSANSYNFAQSVGVGVHTVEVQTRVYLGVAYQNGSAVAQATCGVGTVTVESVRLVAKGATIDF